MTLKGTGRAIPGVKACGREGSIDDGQSVVPETSRMAGCAPRSTALKMSADASPPLIPVGAATWPGVKGRGIKYGRLSPSPASRSPLPQPVPALVSHRLLGITQLP